MNLTTFSFNQTLARHWHFAKAHFSGDLEVFSGLVLVGLSTKRLPSKRKAPLNGRLFSGWAFCANLVGP